MTDANFEYDIDDYSDDYSDDAALRRHGFERLWETPEAVRWLYNNYIPRGSLVVLAGESGIGKSALAVDFIAATTTTTPFAGHNYAISRLGENAELDATMDETLVPSIAVYLHGEGGESLRARFAAAYEARKRKFLDRNARAFTHADMSQLPIFLKELMCTSDGSNSLRSNVERMKTAKDYRRMAKATGLWCGVVVVDTLAAVGGISAENDNGMMQDRINSLKELGRSFNATVFAIAHTKRNTKEIRGASALYNAADVVLRIERQAKSMDVLRLVHEKARHGQKQSPKRFRLIPFAGDAAAVGGGMVPPVIEWLDGSVLDRPPGSARIKPIENIESATRHEHIERDDTSGISIYMKAVRSTVVGQSIFDAVGGVWTTLEATRGVFDRMYQRNAETNRKAFERAHKRAVAEGKVIVSTADDGRQLVRDVE